MGETMIYWLDTEMFDDLENYNEWYGRMSVQRRAKIDRYRFLNGKKLSLGAGVLLCHGLAAYGLSEHSARIGQGKNGKPYLRDYPGIHFNLSHSGTLAAAVFSDVRAGCDIQEMRQKDEMQLARRFFCGGEYRYLAAIGDEAERRRAFCRLWTLKESFLKTTGEGLNCPLDQFEFQVLQGGGISLVQDVEPGEFYFFERDIGEYHLAVCQEGKKEFGNLEQVAGRMIRF